MDSIGDFQCHNITKLDFGASDVDVFCHMALLEC